MQPCTCNICLSKKDVDKPNNKKIQAAFSRLMEWLHATREFKIRDIKSPIVRSMISETAAVFNGAVDVELKNVPPDDVLVRSLKQSGYVFSSFKTLAQIKEAQNLLVDNKGDIKPFEQYLNDVQAINKEYNERYLFSEYKFAVASAQMADKWVRFVKDGDRYDLQYRTANDNRVRDTHAELHNVTLPVDSPFWDKYFPPNGWGCRCTVVQVRQGKHPRANLREAMKRGDDATSGTYAKMFRFNPGKLGTLFPPHNPYTPSRCSGCSKSGFPLAKIPDNELCAACPLIREMAKNEEEVRIRRKEIFKEARKSIQGTTIKHKDLHKDISISRNSIKEFLNQPHKYRKEKNELLLDIRKVISESDYRGVSEPYMKKQDFDSHIFEVIVGGEKSWIIVREYNDGEVLLHSISDNENVTKGIKKATKQAPL